MKYIFLDIDGVLNYSGCKERCCGYVGIDDGCMDNLAALVAATGAQIVLVSSWKDLDRKGEMYGYMLGKFSKHGLSISDDTLSIEETLEGTSDRRGRAIKIWLRKHGFKQSEGDRFVILDDDSFDYKEERISSHWVRTCFYYDGFSELFEKNAERLLNGGPSGKTLTSARRRANMIPKKAE